MVKFEEYPLMGKKRQIGSSLWQSAWGIDVIRSIRSFEEYAGDGETVTVVYNETYAFFISQESVEDLGENLGKYFDLIEKTRFLGLCGITDNRVLDGICYIKPEGAIPLHLGPLPKVFYRGKYFDEYIQYVDYIMRDEMRKIQGGATKIVFQLRKEWELRESMDERNYGMFYSVYGRFAWGVMPAGYIQVMGCE
jgi:hypothetical protein